MSSLWRYVAPMISTGVIKKIDLVNKFTNSNPPIYVWSVTMKNNQTYDLNNTKFNNYENNPELSKEDKKAVYDAIENNKKLIREEILKIYTKIF